mmetsp:Transcript_7652/g.14293  ORF Transcript_7652/g.14293 Transcript_7652/m.14293 type:complete len:83 (+) Transcript_7652:339-587(+)
MQPCCMHHFKKHGEWGVATTVFMGACSFDRNNISIINVKNQLGNMHVLPCAHCLDSCKIAKNSAGARVMPHEGHCAQVLAPE